MECFRIFSGEITGRIDPHFYKKDFNINFGNYDVKELAEICNNITDGDHGNPEYSKNGIAYLRVTDVKEGKIEENGLLEIDIKYAEKLSKSCFANAGDILISVVGTLGESVLIGINDLPLAISRGFAILSIKENIDFNPLYIYFYTKTNMFLKQLYKNKVGSVQKGVYLNSLKKIKMPMPPLEVQHEIISIMKNAYQIKRQKNDDAEQLLESINDFVLNELKCTVQSSNKFCFSIHFNEIKNRLDPLYYSKDLFSFMNTSPYKQMKIEEITSYLKTGFAAGAQDQEEANGILQIRPTNINDKRLLCFDKNVYVKSELLPKRRSSLVRKKEILFNNTNSQELIGKTAFFDLDGNFFCSNHITRIKVKESIISPEYLWVILNLYQRNKTFFNICTNWNNQSGVNVELLKSLNILVPPLEVQKTITDEVEFRIEKAELLQQEAQQILEKAKLEVEEILLRS